MCGDFSHSPGVFRILTGAQPHLMRKADRPVADKVGAALHVGGDQYRNFTVLLNDLMAFKQKHW